MARVFLGIPHTGQVIAQGLMSVLNASEEGHEVMVVPAGGSLLCLNFNTLWVQNLNLEGGPADYFVMMHADQAVEPGWLDKLIKIIDETGADVVSCAIPIKDGRGLLSAGLGKYDKNGFRKHRRITLKELQTLPETFGTEHVQGLFDEPVAGDTFLTVNTGLWIARKGEWMKHFRGFNIEDTIVQLEDGKFQARVWPEDWKFSQWAAESGLDVRCTKAVKIEHIGIQGFPNHQVWGQPADTFGNMA